MADFIINVLLHLSGFAIGTWFGIHWARRSTKAKPSAATSTQNLYGHPRPPVAALRSRIPGPPMDHAWEIAVIHNASGTPFLHLSLLNLISGEAVAETKTDLVNGGYPWRTWAAYYRNWSSASTRRQAFDDKIIGPMVDWATGHVNRVANANAVGEHIVEAS